MGRESPPVLGTLCWLHEPTLTSVTLVGRTSRRDNSQFWGSYWPAGAARPRKMSNDEQS
jgi:hypothetical protein